MSATGEMGQAMSRRRAAPGAEPSGGRALGRVLVVEDERDVAELIRYNLAKEGYDVTTAASGTEALRRAREVGPDLVLLDIMVPQLNGWEVCRRLKQDPETGGIPVIMVTGRVEEGDKVLGFEMGADDYVTKPFSPREIVARVKAILRRAEGVRPAAAVHRVGTVEVDTGRREVRVDGTPVALATREFDLLQHLAEHVGLALSRRQLLDGVWGSDWYGDDRTVDVHVRQLRKKLGDALPLTTVWGVGYRLG